MDTKKPGRMNAQEEGALYRTGAPWHLTLKANVDDCLRTGSARDEEAAVMETTAEP